MRFTTKTEYGVICLVRMAQQSGERVTIKDLVREEHYPIPYIEKILRSLRVGGIVESYQGNQGGYVLARPPSEITFKEIIDALEGDTFDVFCDPDARGESMICNHSALCQVAPVWRKTKELIDRFFASITLEMIANNEVDKAMLPIDFGKGVAHEYEGNRGLYKPGV